LGIGAIVKDVAVVRVERGGVEALFSVV